MSYTDDQIDQKLKAKADVGCVYNTCEMNQLLANKLGIDAFNQKFADLNTLQANLANYQFVFKGYINDEVTARQADFVTLNNNIANQVNAESLLRSSQDALLKQQIDNESNRAQIAEKNLFSSMSSLSTGSTKAYATLALAQADQANIPKNSTVNITADTDANNGLYLFDGSSLSKSQFDPLTQAKSYTDLKSQSDFNSSINFALSGGVFEDINMSSFQFGSYIDANTGSLMFSNSDLSTDFIPVKKGDCFIIVHPTTANMSTDFIHLYDLNKNNRGSLACSDTSELRGYLPVMDDFQKSLLNISSDYSRIYSQKICIPEDGFIRLSYPTSAFVNNAGAFGKFRVVKTNYKTLVKVLNSNYQNNVLPFFEGIISTPICEKVNTYVETLSQTVGSQISYISNNNNAVSIRYPIKKGQYIHIVGAKYGKRAELIFEGNAGEYLGSVTPCSLYSPMVDSFNRDIASFNTVSPFDGYVRFQWNVTPLPFVAFGITDHYVGYKKDYFDNTKTLSSFKTASMYPFSSPQDGYLESFPYAGSGLSLLSVGRGNGGDFAKYSTTYKPILLKKGDVLRYRAKTGLNFLGWVFKHEDDLTTSQPLALINNKARDINWLMSNLIFQDDGNGFRDTVLPSTFPDPINIETAYYNSQSDVIIYLQNGGNYDDYDVEVMTVEQYKKYRNQNILPNLTMCAGNVWDTGGSNYVGIHTAHVEPVLVFKDELITYPTNRFATSLADTNFNQQKSTSFFANRLNMITGNYTYGYDEDRLLFDKSTGKYTLGYGFAQYTEQMPYDGYLVVNANVLNYINNKWSADNYIRWDLLLKQYPFSAIDYKDYKPQLVPKFQLKEAKMTWVSNVTPDNTVAFQSSAGTSVSIMPIKKGHYYSIEGNTSFWHETSRLAYWNQDQKQFTTEGLYAPDGKTIDSFQTYQPIKFYLKAPSDGFVIIHDYQPRYGNYTVDPVIQLQSDDWARVNINEITELEYRTKAVSTDKTFVVVPRTKNLQVNIIGKLPSDTTKAVSTKGLVQFMEGSTILVSVCAMLTVNGEGSASGTKPSIKMDFCLSDYATDVDVKVGSWQSVSSLVLKSFNTEKTNLRETVCMSMWRDMRYSSQYPSNQLIDIESVIAQSGTDQYIGNPIASTDGFPVNLLVGDLFYGVYTLRSRAKRNDYALKKSNNNHIQMAMDWWLKRAWSSWLNFDLSAWEVVNPSLKKYTAGDSTLPSQYKDVEANIRRFFSWIADCNLGKVNMKSTYKSYIKDLNNWLDFNIFCELTGNWDAGGNNNSIATWDGTHWYVFPYDLDGTLGYGVNDTIYDANTIFSNVELYALIHKNFNSEINQRYAYLRSNGVNTLGSWFNRLKEYDSYISSDAHSKDSAYWGVGQTTSMSYIMNWLRYRFIRIDLYYNFLDTSNGVVYQQLWNPPALTSGSSQTLDVNVSSAKSGMQYTVNCSSDLQGTTLSAISNKDGVVTITHTNNTKNSIDLSEFAMQLVSY